MNLLSDIITYVRRIVKSPSDAQLSDSLICDYINRFWIMDMDARMQLYDLKTTYEFQTIPGIIDYNMPLYTTQQSALQQPIGFYPVYQGFLDPCFANGIALPFYTEKNTFYNFWPNYTQSLSSVATGDGVTSTFQFSLPFFPAIPGHVDLTGIVKSGNIIDPIFNNALDLTIPPTSVHPRVYFTYTNQNGSNSIVCDSGQFLSSGTVPLNQDLYGLLMVQGSAGGTNSSLGAYDENTNTVNYNTGLVNVTFPSVPAAGTEIQAQCYFFNQGIPRSILYYNNTLTILPPPNTQYVMSLTAYLTPAAFLDTTESIPFAYMAEYIARGAARKILSDTGDIEQFNFYEPLFKEQEMLVWKRSQRQFTSTRTPTIFSDLQGQSGFNNIGQGAL